MNQECLELVSVVLQALNVMAHLVARQGAAQAVGSNCQAVKVGRTHAELRRP